MNPLRRWFREDRRPRGRGKARPTLEALESRVVLYGATGTAWPNPQIITISFMPDGTQIGGNYTSNLFSTFNNSPSLAGKWQNIILQAAQEWAQQTNINLTVVPDDGAPQGSGPDMQGDPGFGDIRIGGFNFGSGNPPLALTYLPPQDNNFSVAGDVAFNTGEPFHNGTTYDLFTVAMHEIGHALGLGESRVIGSVMYGNYSGTMKHLASDDIAGIRAIYSVNAPRSPDAYNSNGASNGTLSAASSINSLVNASTLTALVPNLDISTAGQQEWFSFTAPAGSSGTMELSAQSSGLSLLAPKITVYSSDGSTVLATASGEGQYTGSTQTVSVPNVVAGNTYYVMVQGADTTQMGTGDYALGVNFNGGTPPTEASPTVAVPDGNPEHIGGGEAYHAPRYGILPDQVHRREQHQRSRPDAGRQRPRPADTDPGLVAGRGRNSRPLQGANDRTDGRRGR
jgi:Matrixin